MATLKKNNPKEIAKPAKKIVKAAVKESVVLSKSTSKKTNTAKKTSTTKVAKPIAKSTTKVKLAPKAAVAKKNSSAKTVSAKAKTNVKVSSIKKAEVKPTKAKQSVAKKAIVKTTAKQKSNAVVQKLKQLPKTKPNNVKPTVEKNKAKVNAPIAKNNKTTSKTVVKLSTVDKVAKNIKPVDNKTKVEETKLPKAIVAAAKTKITEPNIATKKGAKKTSVTSKQPTHGYIKYELEFPMHASRQSIFNFVTDASALSAWFADNVNLINEEYVFTWGGVPQVAKVIHWKESQTVRYHWLHEPDGTYFEFSIVEDELTSDLALIVTDFAEDESSVEPAKRLWQSQISDLHHAIGG